MIKVWDEIMSDKEAKDIAYWERNMLALRYADGWYNDDAFCMHEGLRYPDDYHCATCKKFPRYAGWRRVISLDNGQMTFHIPDDFDVGDLKQIPNNWDGHTTEGKWLRIMRMRQCDGRGLG